MNQARDTTGPLTPLQHIIFQRLREGATHAQIGAELDKGKSHISQIVASATAKMGHRKSVAALAQYTRAETFREVAQLNDERIISRPVTPEEHEANWATELFSQMLRARAEELLP